MATFIAIASFAWTLAVSILKSIDWSSKLTLCVLAFVGGCQFDRSVLWHPKASPSVVSPDNPSPRKPILPWRVSEAGAAERQYEPKPDPISTPGAKHEIIQPPKIADVLDIINAEQNAKLDPNPTPVGSSAAKKSATGSQCGPNGCGSPRRAGLFGRWRG